jgi:nucleotide-binding universal stress UspA family protein
MQKLLIPVDSSENAMRALHHALRLARENGPVELLIVTAHEAAASSPRVLAYRSLEEVEKIYKEQSEAILRPALAAAAAAGVKYESEIVIGDIPKTIVDCAEARGCDGIVMGTRGMGAIGNLVMGSVATKVIHLTKLPVTLVK